MTWYWIVVLLFAWGAFGVALAATWRSGRNELENSWQIAIWIFVCGPFVWFVFACLALKHLWKVIRK